MHLLSRLLCQVDSKRERLLENDSFQWSEKPRKFASPKPEKRERSEKAEKSDKRARPEMCHKPARRGRRLHSAKPPSTLSSSSTSSKEVYSMASLEVQISKNLDPLLKWASEKEFSAENIVFLRAVRDFKKKWTMVAKQEQQRLRPRPARRPLGRSRAYYTTLSQRHDDGLPATPNGATIDDRCLSPELRRERYEDAASIWFTLVNPLTARFNINIDYRTYSDLEALFHGLRWRPFCASDNDDDDGATRSSRSDKSDNMVAPWDGYESDNRPRRPPQRASAAVPLSDVDRLYKIPVTEVALADDDDDEEDGAGGTSLYPDGGDGATLSTEAETARLRVPPGFGIDVFDRAYESVKTDVFLNTWPNYEAAFAVRCSGPSDRRAPARRRQPWMEDGLLRRAADRVLRRR